MFDLSQRLYIVPKEKKKLVSELKAALKDADELILHSLDALDDFFPFE